MNQKYCLVITLLFTFACKAGDDYVTIAILAKDKAHTLPLYLQCLETQTWPKEKTYLYIRTNNNNDETVEILQNWIEKVSDQYAEIYFDDSDVDVPVQQYKQHEWTYDRFKVLGEIRQDSVDWAYAHNSHYFVADCDNFVCPDTIESMMKTNLPIIAPFLRCSDYEKRFYSNYHETIDVNGYYLASTFYYDILDQKVRGIIEVPVVHCTYFIRYDVLDKICYDDESWRYEYVIFSDSARKQNIPQYIDNRKIYGYISFAESTQEFQKEEFLNKF